MTRPAYEWFMGLRNVIVYWEESFTKPRTYPGRIAMESGELVKGFVVKVVKGTEFDVGLDIGNKVGKLEFDIIANKDGSGFLKYVILDGNDSGKVGFKRFKEEFLKDIRYI